MRFPVAAPVLSEGGRTRDAAVQVAAGEVVKPKVGRGLVQQRIVAPGNRILRRQPAHALRLVEAQARTRRRPKVIVLQFTGRLRTAVTAN